MQLFNKLFSCRNDSALFLRCLAAEERNETLEQEMQVLINRCKAIGHLAEFIETELKTHEDMPNVKTL